MLSLLNKIFYSRISAKILLKPLLRIHTFLSSALGAWASSLEGNIHPKHRIVKYEDWFFENIEEGWTILDIGSNTGILAKKLSSKASYIYGLEIKEKLTRNAKRLNHGDNIEYICADATDYDYAQCRKIDCAILSNVLEHIEERVEFLKLLSSKAPWKESTILLIRVPALDRDWLTVYKKELGLDWRLDKTHFIEYTEEAFFEEMSKADLKVESFSVKFGEIYAICSQRK